MALHTLNSRTATVIFSALLLGTNLVSCSRFYSADKFVEEAKNYEKKGDNQSALIQLKNALQKNPHHVVARVMLGDLYLHLGDGASAENEYRKAADLGAKDDQIDTKIARALFEQGKFKKLLDETSVSGSKPTPEMFTVRGNAYIFLNDKVHAKEAFELALKEQPNFAQALIGLAKLALMDKDIEAANSYANQAVTNNPKDVDSWLFMGKLFRAQNKPTEALNAFNTALTVQPDNFNALLERANLEISLKKFTEAQADLAAVLKIVPKNVMANYVQAELDYFQGKHKEAIAALEELRKGAPRYLPAVLLSGVVNMALGSTAQAEIFLKKYLEDVPNNTLALKLLAQCQLKDGQSKQAMETLTKAMKYSDGKDSKLYAMLGEAALQSKDYSKANGYFNQAITLTPNDPDLHTKLAVNDLISGNNTNAVKELDSALSLNDKTNAPRSNLILTITYMRSHEPDKALVSAQNLQKEQPTNPMVPNMIGSIYLEKNDRANARLNFEKALQLQANYFPAISNLVMMDIQDHQYDAGKNRLLALLKQDKNNLDGELALAGLATQRGQMDESKKWLEQAYNDHPDQIRAASALIGFYLRSHENQKALTLAEKIQASQPDNQDYLMLLAKTQQLANDKQGAIDSLTKLAAQHPDSADYEYQVALAYLRANDNTNATDVLKKTLIIDPDYLNALFVLAELDARNADFDQALQIAKQLQQRDGKQVDGLVLEGNILMRQKNYAAASAAFDSAFRLNKQSVILAKWHSAMVQNHKEKEADDKLVSWLKEHPTDNVARIYYADYLFNTQKSKMAAIAQLLDALKIDPKNPAILNNLAWAYDVENRPEAMQYAQLANQISADNPQIMDTYGWILARKGDYAHAVPLLQKSVAALPDAGEIRYHYAYALFNSGSKELARKELVQITSGKDFPSMAAAKDLLKQIAS